VVSSHLGWGEGWLALRYSWSNVDVPLDFHNWIDFDGVAFSTEFPAESPDRVANSYCHDFGMKNAGLWNLKNGKIHRIANALECFYCR